MKIVGTIPTELEITDREVEPLMVNIATEYY